MLIAASPSPIKTGHKLDRSIIAILVLRGCLILFMSQIPDREADQIPATRY